MKKLLIIDVAALGYELLRAGGRLEFDGLRFAPAEGVFPALTCTVQASFRTAGPPAGHGMVANGRFFRKLARVMFWEQSAGLVGGRRLWHGFRSRGGRVGMLFWQQSLGEDADVLLSPAPIHKHHGGMIQDCYSAPAGLYQSLCEAVGGRFNLMRYWGPLASAKVGDWIAAATAALLLDGKTAPELCLTYLPTLDYDLQRFGPAHKRSTATLARLFDQLRLMLAAAKRNGYQVLIFGDYAMSACAGGPVFPNRALCESGLLRTRSISGMSYLDLHASRAFALADHEIAHVFVRNAQDIAPARQVLANLPGVAEILDKDSQKAAGLDHPNSGELVITADGGRWLAYPWWSKNSQAPDYARHVDIHNKPGYDPCELFFERFGWPPMCVSSDASRVRGSHGTAGPGRQVAWAATFDLGQPTGSLIELAEAVRTWLDAP
ncbi:MAG: alkaline phosphatase family protein [Planctomycetota bacterium]|nr:alkaline phosphatase family protein [Planctomycetota bacterium]